MAEEAKYQALTVFPTRVLSSLADDYERLNTELKLAIFRERARNPEGIYRSNSSGTWHSDDRLFEWAGDAGKELRTIFCKQFIQHAELMAVEKGGRFDVRANAWAMVYSDRGYATVHTHPNCHLSGVYYVDTGTPRDTVMATGVNVKAGEIEFVDTRGAGGLQVQGLNLQSAARIEPKAGRMLTFPNWLPHFVHPVIGDEERISIACNATIVKYTPPQEKSDESEQARGSD